MTASFAHQYHLDRGKIIAMAKDVDSQRVQQALSSE